MLSDREIVEEVAKGSIIVEPFDFKSLGPNSYDVRLGENFFYERFVEAECDGSGSGSDDDSAAPESFINIYDEKSVENLFEHAVAPTESFVEQLKGRQVYWLQPGGRVLGHTVEFIGGLSLGEKGGITTMIKTRSSMGRAGISTALCAGSGDVGYVNRWTLEISNHWQSHSVPLVCGERVAQILFFRTGPSATYTGSYQSPVKDRTDVDRIIREWCPKQMLPRLKLDGAPPPPAPDAAPEKKD